MSWNIFERSELCISNIKREIYLIKGLMLGKWKRCFNNLMVEVSGLFIVYRIRGGSECRDFGFEVFFIRYSYKSIRIFRFSIFNVYVSCIEVRILNLF